MVEMQKDGPIAFVETMAPPRLLAFWNKYRDEAMPSSLQYRIQFFIFIKLLWQTYTKINTEYHLPDYKPGITAAMESTS